jgi:hypothetical protein
MIIKNGKETSLVYYGTRAVSAIYRNGKLLWQAVRSCFGSGFWSNLKPWRNDEAWKN